MTDDGGGWRFYLGILGTRGQLPLPSTTNLKSKDCYNILNLALQVKLFWDQTSSQPGHQAPPSLLEVKSLPPTLQENGCVWQLCHRKQIGLIFLTQIEPARCFWHAGISFFSIVRASIGRGGSSWAGLAADLKTYHIRTSFSRYIRLIPPPNQDRIP